MEKKYKHINIKNVNIENKTAGRGQSPRTLSEWELSRLPLCNQRVCVRPLCGSKYIQTQEHNLSINGFSLRKLVQHFSEALQQYCCIRLHFCPVMTGVESSADAKAKGDAQRPLQGCVQNQSMIYFMLDVTVSVTAS